MQNSTNSAQRIKRLEFNEVLTGTRTQGRCDPALYPAVLPSHRPAPVAPPCASPRTATTSHVCSNAGQLSLAAALCTGSAPALRSTRLDARSTRSQSLNPEPSTLAWQARAVSGVRWTRRLMSSAPNSAWPSKRASKAQHWRACPGTLRFRSSGAFDHSCRGRGPAGHATMRVLTAVSGSRPSVLAHSSPSTTPTKGCDGPTRSRATSRQATTCLSCRARWRPSRYRLSLQNPWRVNTPCANTAPTTPS